MCGNSPNICAKDNLKYFQLLLEGAYCLQECYAVVMLWLLWPPNHI